MNTKATYSKAFIEEKLKNTNETIAEIQKKLAKLASNQKNPDRAVEVLDGYQGQLTALNNDFAECLEWEQGRGRL